MFNVLFSAWTWFLLAREHAEPLLKESELSRPFIVCLSAFHFCLCFHWFLNIKFHLGYEKWLFFSPLSLVMRIPAFSTASFFSLSLLMISSLFGKSTLWHSREMSMFGWGKITVTLDLLNSLFLSALNSHSTGSLSLQLLTHYYPLLHLIIIGVWYDLFSQRSAIQRSVLLQDVFS